MTTAESTGQGQGLLVVSGGPESLFRVAGPSEDGDAVRSSMPQGPWLNGPDGRPPAGVLGVLIDNVLGYAIMLRRPTGRWSVSAEISLDLFGTDLWGQSLDGLRLLSAEARNEHSDESGGIAAGSVTDDSGRLLARCRQRGRWVPTAPSPPPTATQATMPSWAPPESPGLAEVLGIPAAVGSGAYLEVSVTGNLVNPLGNLHGGVALYVCDLVAQVAVGVEGGPWRTASIHVAYPRPLPAGTVARFEGRVMHRGRSFAVIQVTAWNGSGKPCVIATVTAGAPDEDDTP